MRRQAELPAGAAARSSSRGTWRIALTFFEEYRFAPSGFIHAACAADYFETIEILDRVPQFSPGLGRDDLDDLGRALRAKRSTH